MTNKKPLSIISIIIVVIFVLIYGCFISIEKGIKYHNQTETFEGEIMLKVVSQRVGIEFTNSLELREYVYCDLLKKGMTLEEINQGLLKIGEFEPSDTQIDFKDEYLYFNLSPLMLVFDTYTPDGRLIDWYGSTENNFGAPRASCESQ
jgi:hypothetical protein